MITATRCTLTMGRTVKAKGKSGRPKKLDPFAWDDLMRRYATGEANQPQLAREYGVHQATISRYLYQYVKE